MLSVTELQRVRDLMTAGVPILTAFDQVEREISAAQTTGDPMTPAGTAEARTGRVPE